MTIFPRGFRGCWECSRASTPSRGTFGGSLHHFADLTGLPLADASSNVYDHAGVQTYRRLVALTDEYALDVFRASGGKQHDLPLHAPTTEVTFDNLAFGRPRPGSLAGEKYKWGQLQLNDGDMEGHPNRPYWNPPPKNGYGFLVQPASAQPAGDWAATWLLKDEADTRFQLLPLHDPDTRVITAVAPGLYPSFPKARYVIRRRTGSNLSSCFVSIWQAATDATPFPVKSVRRIDTGPTLSADAGLAISVALADGRRDLWAFAPNADTAVTAKDANLSIALHGAFAACRLDRTELVSAHMLDAKTLTVAGWTITLDSPDRSASVNRLPDGSPTIHIHDHWPDDDRYNTNPLYVSNPRYSRNSPYTINRVAGRRIHLEQNDTVLGRGIVHEIPDANTLLTRTPHEYARSVTHHSPTGFFCGKLIRTDDASAATHVRDVKFGNPMAIHVDSTARFKPGQTFYYHDVQPGDTATVHHHAALNRLSPQTFRLQTNTDITLTAPRHGQIQYLDKTGQPQPAPAGKIPRRNLSPSGKTTITLLD